MQGLSIDLFAGGGGASEGFRMAMGRDPDVAINHDPEAIAMHKANHPGTMHYIQDVWQVPPRWVTKGKLVAFLWASPDCTHFSKAKGAAPTRDAKRRDLAWVIVKWACEVRPAVICMENVEEFLSWGPLDSKGRIISDQAGATFRSFVASLRRLGYSVQWREMRACDYGAPTIRKRLFLIARCDGQPIVWPEPTHGPGRAHPYRTAADVIDWSLPCPSIFERKRPLAENTLRRIAEGIRRYVIEAAEPFILNITHGGRLEPVSGPLRTITCAKRGEKAVVVPSFVTYYGPKKPGDFRGCGPEGLFGTQTTENRHALVAALLKHFTGVVGQDVREPLGTVTTVDHHSLLTSHLLKLRGTCKHGQPVDAPMPTITASGTHVGEVRAFLMKYYREGGQWQSCADPVHTLTTKARMGLVTVMIKGEPYVIADIGMRMLTPRELYRAQGFRESYFIDLEVNGKPLTKASQVRMCGNSVSPYNAKAIIAENYPAELPQRVVGGPLMGLGA